MTEVPFSPPSTAVHKPLLFLLSRIANILMLDGNLLGMQRTAHRLHFHKAIKHILGFLTYSFIFQRNNHLNNILAKAFWLFLFSGVALALFQLL